MQLRTPIGRFSFRLSRRPGARERVTWRSGLAEMEGVKNRKKKEKKRMEGNEEKRETNTAFVFGRPSRVLRNRTNASRSRDTPVEYYSALFIIPGVPRASPVPFRWNKHQRRSVSRSAPLARDSSRRVDIFASKYPPGRSLSLRRGKEVSPGRQAGKDAGFSRQGLLLLARTCTGYNDRDNGTRITKIANQTTEGATMFSRERERYTAKQGEPT